MTRWDTVRYHDTVCTVEYEIDHDDHLIAIRPLNADGVYIVHEEDCERCDG